MICVKYQKEKTMETSQLSLKKAKIITAYLIGFRPPQKQTNIANKLRKNASHIIGKI